MNRSSLVVFVHGIGANSGNWWGSTPDALLSDQQLSHIDWHFYGYDTSKLPERPWWKPQWLLETKLANLEEIGMDLWADLLQYRQQGTDAITLFAHSMGGLVAAAALAHGFRREADEADMALRDAIRCVALCATPLGGSDLAKLAQTLTVSYGRNQHLDDLSRDSARRNRIVAQLKNCVSVGGEAKHGYVPLEFFTVAQDTTVSTDEERFGPFHQQRSQLKRYPLDGGHSECVMNLKPGDKNYDRITSWLKYYHPRTPAAAHPVPAKNETLNSNDFDALVKELERELAVDGVFYRWAPSEDREVPSAVVMLRIFLQKLLHAATTIHVGARSANAWVCHNEDADGHPYALRSEEREGYFSVEQLVNANGLVRYRWNTISWEPKQTEELSIAAYIVVKEDVMVKSVERSRFSIAEERARITHILGIPLHRIKKGEDGRLRGVPLSITVDFAISGDLESNAKENIEARGRKLADLYRKFEEKNLPRIFSIDGN